MRHFLGRPLQCVALWVGILALAGVVSVSAWLLLRDNDVGPVEVTSQGAPAMLEAGAGPAASGVTMGDSAELEVKRGGPATGEAESTQSKETAGTGPGLTAADATTLSDHAEVAVMYADPLPARDDPGHSGDVRDSTTLAVSDTAELSVQAGQPASSGGPGNVATIGRSEARAVLDTAELSLQPGQPAPSAG